MSGATCKFDVIDIGSSFHFTHPPCFLWVFRSIGIPHESLLPFFLSVTYFVTYGTAMACYAYFVLTKQEYLFKEASDRQYLLNFYKRAQGLR